MKEIPLEKVKNAKKESKFVEFKEKLEINQAQDWCEVIKDIVAIANSGGGWLLIGVKRDGSPSGWDVTPILNLDPAQITDKMAKYTDEQFADFEIQEAEKRGQNIAAIQIQGVSIPMIFTQPGTYDIGEGKQKTAFGKGTIYFRHGAKSEPGNSKDLKDCINREIEQVRKSWLGNIRKVVTAPSGYKVTVLPKEIVESEVPSATPIRLVNDLSAPVYRKIDPDKTHPYRQKEVLQLINQRIGEKRKVTPYDTFCLRKVREIDTKPNFFYKSKFASPQYSDSFVKWLIEQFEKDNEFFDKARQEWKEKA